MAGARQRMATIDDYVNGVLAGDRAMLGRAITLIESAKDEHAGPAQQLLQRLLPHTGKAHRIGITGVPGVGKSTAIDQLGMNLVEQATGSRCWPSIRPRRGPAARSWATRRG